MRKSEGPYWIEQLALEKHPEGGWYKETFRSGKAIEIGEVIADYGGPRKFYTSIYFLLDKAEFSAFHRLKSDEIWCYHAGAPLIIYSIDKDGELETHTLGPDIGSRQQLQVLIPAGRWFAAEVSHTLSYTLSGCIMAPGFEFEDFELAGAEELSTTYPAHKELIQRLCARP